MRTTVPLTLSNFEVLQTIGTGTFGEVKLCKHFGTNTYYCMKVLNKEKVVRLKQQEHAKNEKMTLSMVVHPFLVKLYTTFQDPCHLYFIMEYVPGGELFNIIRSQRGLSENEA